MRERALKLIIMTVWGFLIWQIYSSVLKWKKKKKTTCSSLNLDSMNVEFRSGGVS